MSTLAPLRVLHNLTQLYEHGFRDTVTDVTLLKIASSQAARDRVVLRDLEHDLRDLEQRYQLSSDEFFRRWQAGEMPDTADFMEWNVLYQMTLEVQERLQLLQSRVDAQ